MEKIVLSRFKSIYKLNIPVLIQTDFIELFLKELKKFLTRELFVTESKILEKTNILEISKLKDSSFITIDQVRAIEDFLTTTSIYSKHKIVIISEANDLNINASNAMLKILENLEKDTYVFFITSNIYQILPTIYSRCLKIKDIRVLKTNLDSKYEYLFCSSTTFKEKIEFIKNFAKNENKDLWLNFAINVEYLLLSLLKKEILKIQTQEVSTEDKDPKFLEQLKKKSNSYGDKIFFYYKIYEEIYKLHSETLKLDLNLSNATLISLGYFI